MKKQLSITLLLGVLVYSSAVANNLPPLASFSNDVNRGFFFAGETVTFDGSGSIDQDEGGSNITRYRWKVDGVTIQESSSPTFSTSFSLTSGQNSKTVQIILEVRDDEFTWTTHEGKFTKTYTVRRGQDRHFYVKDHLGSVRVTVDEAGDPIGFDDYYPFGLQMPTRSSNLSNPNDAYKYTGHERDTEVGLTFDYMGARTYDPMLGTFMQIDPLASMYPQVSPYNYALNNPILLVDRFGLCPEGYNEGDTWDPGDGSGPTLCGPTVEVTADRIEGGYSGYLEGDGRIMFDPSTEEGREGLYNYFYNNHHLVSDFVANNNFSDQSKMIAMQASRAKGGEIFWAYTYQITVSGVTIVSLASGVGAIGLGLNALRTGGGSLLGSQLSTLTLRASGTEFGLRTAGWGAGIDSGTNVVNAGIGAIGGRMLNSSTLVGVNYSNVTGPIFRSVNSGRFVSNTYGGVRIGITSGAQLGLMYGLNQQ